MRNALSFLLLIPLAACAHIGPRPADDAPIHVTAWGDRVTREILIETSRINLMAPQTLILVATREPVRRTLGQSTMPSLEQAVDFLAHELANLRTGAYDMVVVAY
jgi:hypothetical protein